MQKFTAGLKDLPTVCQQIQKLLPRPSVVLLSGPLGAGKTKLVEVLLRVVGGEDVSSPTFALHHEYKVGESKVHHFDLYRIESVDDLETVGLWDVLQSAQDWVFIEWPDRLGDFHSRLPIFEIAIDILGDKRLYTIQTKRPVA
jgi:tRNA threonylcarbamoyladenosine biosynthesis protein TsaE